MNGELDMRPLIPSIGPHPETTLHPTPEVWEEPIPSRIVSLWPLLEQERILEW